MFLGDREKLRGDRGTGNCLVNLGKEGDEVIVGVNAWIEKSVIKRKKASVYGKARKIQKSRSG